MSLDDIKDTIDDALEHDVGVPSVAMKTCPVKPLGHYKGLFYFLSPVGEIRCLKANDFNGNGLLSLFLGNIEWIYEHFEMTGRRQDTRRYNQPEVASVLMQACSDQGIFDPNTRIRGLGVWKLDDMDDHGRPLLAVHCGSALWYGGEWHKPGQKVCGAIFPACPPIEKMADGESSEDDARMVLDCVKRWNWRRPDIDPILFLGFLGQSMLGGAAPWRAHMVVNGMQGAGKSSLASVASSFLGGAAHEQANNYTEAGLRQALTEQARCLILDEAEPEENGRIFAVIELLRQMSGGDGARALRGSADGVAQGYTVAGSALMLSIGKVPLKPQDKSRITQLQLDPLRDDGDPSSWNIIQHELTEIKKLSKKFRRRMVSHWGLFLDNFELYRGEFIKAGLSARGADQMATLMAGYDTLTCDVPQHADAIEDVLHIIKPLIEDEKETKEENEGHHCLNHLYSFQADIYKSGERRTIAQILADALDYKGHGDHQNDNKRLGIYGLRIEYDKKEVGRPISLSVANRHQGLQKVFNGTRWGSGSWSGALEYLNGEPSKPKRYAGVLSRGVTIPVSHWPIDPDNPAVELGVQYDE